MIFTSELRHDKRVNGLRCICFGGPVTVYDAATGRVKRVIKHPKTWEQILDIPGETRNRIHTKAKSKSR